MGLSRLPNHPAPQLNHWLRFAGPPLLLAFSALLAFSTAHALPDVKIDIIEPFGFTYYSESPVMFVRITNTGTETFDFDSSSDLRLENDSALASHSSELAPWARRFSDVRNQAKSEAGRPIRPGDSIVLSQSDYIDMDFSMYNSEYQRIRPHLRVQTGIWIVGDWYGRKIEDAPNLTSAKSLYDFKLGAEGQQHSVIALPGAGETWLVSCRLPSSYKNLPEAFGDIDFRLCRLPDGKMPTSIAHDAEARRLTLSFGGSEEDVVINTRSGMPVSGSERTVPHLHLWKKLAGRPFTDAYQEMLDGMARRKATSQGNPDGQQAPTPRKPVPSGNPGMPGGSTQNAPAAGNGTGSSAGDGPLWKWLFVGIAIVIGGGVALVRILVGRRNKLPQES